MALAFTGVYVSMAGLALNNLALVAGGVVLSFFDSTVMFKRLALKIKQLEQMFTDIVRVEPQSGTE